LSIFADLLKLQGIHNYVTYQNILCRKLMLGIHAHVVHMS